MALKQNENINLWLSHLCDEYKLAVSVDCVIFGYDESDLKVLLIKCNMPPFEGKLSLLGSLIRPDEDLNSAAKRVLNQYTGMQHIYLEQVEAFSHVDRHPLGRVITIAYYSLLSIDNVQIKDLKHKEVQWVSCISINEMAFDHLEILNVCRIRLKKKLRQQPIGFNLLPKKFTINQLRSLYEVVLDIEIDKRNFRRKLNNLNLLIDMEEYQQSVAHRPARLYSFDIQRYHSLKDSGFKFGI